jgi:hypothetical protein
MHGGRCCIRVTVNGARQWQRLDMLKAALCLLFGGDVEDDPLLYSSIVDIGELDQRLESPDFGAAAESGTGELDHSPHIEPAIPVPADPPSLTQRIAAKRAAQLIVGLEATRPATELAHSPPGLDDASLDPLAL